MNRTRIRIILSLSLLLPIVLLLSLTRSTAAQGKSFLWERFDADITLLSNGDLRIVETQSLSFAGGTFSFGFRGVPVGRNGGNDGISDFSVSEGSVQYSRSSSNRPGTFEVNRESGEEVIRWYFEPTVGLHTYSIAYTVHGAVRVGTSEEGSGDQIFWKPTPTDLPSRINSSTVTIRLPEGIRPQQFTDTTSYLVAAYLDGGESNSVRITVSDDARTITYAMGQPIYPGQVFEVRAQFPHGLLAIETPDWQAQEQRGDVIGLVVLVIALLIAVAGPLLVLLLWYMAGRDPEMDVVVPEFVSEPPEELPPAIVGTLVDEKADMRDIVSTLLDLARRGYLVINEQKRDHVFERTEKPEDGLRPFEHQFLRDIFRGKSERSLKSLRYKFAEKLPKLRKMLYDELKNEELVPRSPESVRNSYGCLAFVVIAAAFAGGVALPSMLGDAVSTAICPGFGIGITGVALLVASRYMPVKTRKGTVSAAKWEAFKEYLQNAERYGDLKEATEIFEKYLPYATAFGLERSWITKFASVPNTPVPTWYGPYYGPHYGRGRGVRGGSKTSGSPGTPSLEGMSGSLTGGLQSMSDGLTRMLNSASTVLKSTPPGSSGSSGGFSGGFSGGSSGGGGSAGFG